MRTGFLLPLTAVVTVVLGCGSEGREQTAVSALKRDLTLQPAAPEVEIASRVELQHLRPQHQTKRPSRRDRRPPPAPRPSPAEFKPVPALVAAPVLALPAADMVGQTAGTAADPANDRELPPGKTVTVIPASSGPSTASNWTDDFPTIPRGTLVRGGGRCPPRGRPGIGIATRPRLY